MTQGIQQNVLTNVLFKDRLEKSVGVIASLSAESLYPLEELFVIMLDDSQCQCRPVYRINASQCHRIPLMNIKILFWDLFLQNFYPSYFDGHAIK